MSLYHHVWAQVVAYRSRQEVDNNVQWYLVASAEVVLASNSHPFAHAANVGSSLWSHITLGATFTRGDRSQDSAI